MKKLLIIFSLFFVIIICFSQQNTKSELSFQQLFSRAINYVFEEKYPLAITDWKRLDSLQPGNANVAFQLGFCYLKPPINARKAVLYLEKASASLTSVYKEGDYKERNAPAYSVKYLGDAYHANYEFEIAIVTYERFLNMLPEPDDVKREQVKRAIKSCQDAIRLKQSPVNMTITNVGGAINSSYADYGAVVTADESYLVFTSKREGSTGNLKTKSETFFEDIYISEKIRGEWQSPTHISSNINTSGHEAALALSSDGQTLLLYKYDEIGKGDIYSSMLNGNQWTVPVKLGKNINTEYREAHACMGLEGNYLFFSSDRPGGLGGLDIYFSKKLPNGDWGIAQNCGPDINTSYDENTPYFHPDGYSMFFSSMGHNSIGGYDIFFTERIDEKQWMKAQSMGYPVNSPFDDIFFIPTTDGKRAYYSSYRSDGFGDQDIYMITFPEFKEKPLTVFKGIIKDHDGNVPNNIVIFVTDDETGEEMGNFTPNSFSGKYLIVLPPGRNYNISYEADDYLVHSETINVPMESNYFEINKAIELEPLTATTTIEINTIFFSKNSSELSQNSKKELDRLYKMLVQNPNVVIEIGGYSDSSEDVAESTKVSQSRSESVIKYLSGLGISYNRLVAKPYGSFGSKDAANKNMRVEVKVLSN